MIARPSAAPACGCRRPRHRPYRACPESSSGSGPCLFLVLSLGSAPGLDLPLPFPVIDGEDLVGQGRSAPGRRPPGGRTAVRGQRDLAAGLGGPVGHQGIDMLVGNPAAQDGRARNGHESGCREPGCRSVSLELGLVGHLDEVVLALVDPGVALFVARGITLFLADAPVFTHLLEHAQRQERDHAEPEGNPGPDRMPHRPQHRCREGHHGAQDQQHPLGADQIDQVEAGQEGAQNAADHAPGVDLADGRAGALEPSETIHRELGHDRADRPHRDRREEEHQRGDQEHAVGP